MREPNMAKNRQPLAKDQLWPPCEFCGSDGYPADLGGTGGTFSCLDCNPKWLQRAFAHMPEPDRSNRVAWIISQYSSTREEILALRNDSRSYSYRGLGRVRRDGDRPFERLLDSRFARKLGRKPPRRSGWAR